MYLYDSQFRGLGEWAPEVMRVPSYAPAFAGLGMPSVELDKKLKLLSLFPHRVESNGNNVALTPAVVDPKIYDGLEKYLIAENLQKCLMKVMKKRQFQNVGSALVDMTKGVTQPEFAGFNHKKQVFAASIPKITSMLAAFQLQHDLRAARDDKKPATLAELFDLMRDDWAKTQSAGTKTNFTRGITLAGRLVVVGRGKIALSAPKTPQLERVFAEVPAGSALTINFKSTGEDKATLQTIVDDFNLTLEKNALNAAKEELKQAKTAAARKSAQLKVQDAKRKLEEAKRKKRPAAKFKIQALGFRERLGIAVGGDVPASNFATGTVVQDVGFPYVASTLLQSGLYDTNRNGGLWLGANYAGVTWRGPLAGGAPLGATAGSVATFLTLLAQNSLVSSAASTGMKTFLQKFPDLRFPGTGSWFQIGLGKLTNQGSLKMLLGKVGLAGGKADDCALIEREVDRGGGNKVTLRYAAVALRANSGDDLEQLIREFDKCILLNNGLTLAQGGHS